MEIRERKFDAILLDVDGTLLDFGMSEKQGMKVKDFSSGRKDAKVYALIYQKGPDHFKVLIEPNERMIGAMRRTFPRKLVM